MGGSSRRQPSPPGPEDLVVGNERRSVLLTAAACGVAMAAFRRARVKEDVSPEVFHTTAGLVRRFVEDYHEHLEETFIFPRFPTDHPLSGLVAILRAQHQAGRRLTDRLLHSATAARYGTTEGRQDVVRACEALIRMYRAPRRS